MVAPMPPDKTKPAPSAAAAASGSLGCSFAFTSISERRSSTAPARRLRSASMSRRTCSGVRPLAVAIRLQRLGRLLRLLKRLLGHRRRAFLDLAYAEHAQQ